MKSFKIGDTVTIVRSRPDTTKCGWYEDTMGFLMGKTGKIIRINSYKNFILDISKGYWISPDWVKKQDEQLLFDFMYD